MDYKIINLEDAPLEIQELIKGNIDKEGQQMIDTEKMTYAIFTRGSKSTGGYEIEVDFLEEEKFIEISVKYIDPKENEAQIQVITNPYVIIEFMKTNKEVSIKKI